MFLALETKFLLFQAGQKRDSVLSRSTGHRAFNWLRLWVRPVRPWPRARPRHWRGQRLPRAPPVWVERHTASGSGSGTVEIAASPLPGSGRRAGRRPTLVLPRRFVGLGHGSRYCGGRKEPDAKRGTSGKPGATPKSDTATTLPSGFAEPRTVRSMNRKDLPTFQLGFAISPKPATGRRRAALSVPFCTRDLQHAKPFVYGLCADHAKLTNCETFGWRPSGGTYTLPDGAYPVSLLFSIMGYSIMVNDCDPVCR